MKTWDADVMISYHCYGEEGETAEEAVMNSIDGYNGEIHDIKVLYSKCDDGD